MKNVCSLIVAFVVCACFSSPVKSNIGAKGIEYIEEKTSIPTAADYIQDGIVCMYDGIENAGWGIHGQNETKWLDLISGSYADLNGKGAFEDKEFVFSLRSIGNLRTAPMENAIGSSYFTVETVFTPNTFNYSMFMWGSPQGFCFLILSTYAVRFLSGGTIIWETAGDYALDCHGYSITRSGLIAKAYTEGEQIGNEKECAALGKPTHGIDVPKGFSVKGFTIENYQQKR